MLAYVPTPDTPPGSVYSRACKRGLGDAVIIEFRRLRICLRLPLSLYSVSIRLPFILYMTPLTTFIILV
jgi:hypothetical protein